jgi:hypothetical protein
MAAVGSIASFRTRVSHFRSTPETGHIAALLYMSRRAMYGRCPRCKSKSDFSAKRSGAAMYTAYFRLEGYLCRDAAAVAAGPDVIR